MSEPLLLFDSETAERVGEAEVVEQNLRTPGDIRGWKEVMDCRHPPYTDHSLEENCELADHVRKPYILVEASQIVDEED